MYVYYGCETDPESDAGVQQYREKGHSAADHLYTGEHPGWPAHVRTAM